MKWILKYITFWLALLLLLVIAALTFKSFTISQELKNWEPCSEAEQCLCGETEAGVDISIGHFPPRLAEGDKKIEITIRTRANKETCAYIYIGEENVDFPKTYSRHYISIPEGTRPVNYKLDMGTGNLSSIYMAQVYVADSNNRRISNSIVFEVTPVTKETLGMLITTTAIVLALLSLLAQLIVRIAGTELTKTKKLIATINLFWIYIAIFFAACGLVFFLLNFSQFRITPIFPPLYFIGLGLLSSSILMVMISIFESIVTIAIKGLHKGESEFDPLFIYMPKQVKQFYKWTFDVLCSISMLIFIFFVLCFAWSYICLWLIVGLAIIKLGLYAWTVWRLVID